MATPFSTNAFRNNDMTEALFDAVDQIRATFEKRVATRVSRGDVRTAVLALLTEEPMHGYQIIREIEERSGGTWKPSAGSVYPTLQMLSDEGFIEASESNGRKTYALTEEGKPEAETAAQTPPWKDHSHVGSAATALPKAGLELAQAAAQVARSGSAEQKEAAVQELAEARRKMYAILAQD